MRKKLQEIKERFITTMKKAAKFANISPSELTRDIYVRTCVDNKIDGRLNKEQLNMLGGFKRLRDEEFPKPEELQEGPKVLFFDIETAPVVAYVWGLWENNVGLNQIKSDWYVLSFAAKWAGNNEVIYFDQSQAKDIENDKNILKEIWKLLDEADIIIGQNSKKFDIKKLNARFIEHGFQPPSTFKHIDTLQIAKKYFGFTSNKLAYMTDKLCTKYKKLSHAKFSGFELWRECLKGNPEAWREMREYNEVDVLSLEELFQKLSPWHGGINYSIYTQSEEHLCRCGNKELKKSGFHYTTAGKYQKYKCTKCGHETRDNKNLLSLSKRKSLRKRLPR